VLAAIQAAHIPVIGSLVRIVEGLRTFILSLRGRAVENGAGAGRGNALEGAAGGFKPPFLRGLQIKAVDP
jgi:hypothetical protein